MDILLCTVFGVFILLSFVIGVRIGQKVNNNEPIELNPVKVYKDYKEEEESKRQLKFSEEVMNTMLENIDNYNGTAEGQKDIKIRW